MVNVFTRDSRPLKVYRGAGWGGRPGPYSRGQRRARDLKGLVGLCFVDRFAVLPVRAAHTLPDCYRTHMRTGERLSSTRVSRHPRGHGCSCLVPGVLGFVDPGVVCGRQVVGVSLHAVVGGGIGLVRWDRDGKTNLCKDQ